MSPRSLFARIRATGYLWNSLLVVIDAGVVVAATIVAYYARFDGAPPEQFARYMLPLAGVAAALYVVLFALFGLYRLVLRYVGVDTLIKLLAATLIGSAVLLAVDIGLTQDDNMRLVPIGVLFMQSILVFLGGSGARLTARVVLHVRAASASGGRRILIIGGGSAASLLLREIQNRPDLDLTVVGFLDDQPALRNRTIGGVPVLGRTDALAQTVASRNIKEVIVAMPSAPREKVRAILNAAAEAGVQTRVMPPIVIARGSVSLRDLRSVDVEDLLGREPTPIDVEQVAETIRGRIVAVTGAAGSIGSELCRQVAGLDPERLLLIDIDESRLYELWLELESTRPGLAAVKICDIRDADKLDRLMASERPAVVLHSAAYKHVPLMEDAPEEAIKTNVGGTISLIQACEHHGVERFVLISTDKAVAPVNMMGLTKAMAELVMLDAARRGTLDVMAVRFGNVLASRGSVVPIFEEQLRHGGPLTVTHQEVTRYFMTIPEAARLVLQAQAIGESGDIFVLEMGEPVRIVELARKMIALSGVPAEIEFVGLRPGEKLHESLIGANETLLPTDRQNILRVDRVVVPRPDSAEKITALVEAAWCGDEEAIHTALVHVDPEYFSRSGEAATPSRPSP